MNDSGVGGADSWGQNCPFLAKSTYFLFRVNLAILIRDLEVELKLTLFKGLVSCPGHRRHSNLTYRSSIFNEVVDDSRLASPNYYNFCAFLHFNHLRQIARFKGDISFINSKSAFFLLYTKQPLKKFCSVL